MRRCLPLLLLATGAAQAADAPKLTGQDVAEGWVILFDGESTFGWTIDGDAAVKDGMLVLGGDKPTTATTTVQLAEFRYRWKWHKLNADGKAPTILIAGEKMENVEDQGAKASREERLAGHRGSLGPIVLKVPAGSLVAFDEVSVQPQKLRPIFNGKDLSGWKRFTADEKRAKSKFAVTPEGWLNVTNGPGDLQTEKSWADFVFQGDCISNGKHLNSGVFFRCLPGQYQQGYEFQVQNGYKDGDRTKPADYGTGAIYRRVPARKVVSNDGEWFTMTLVARGNHMATWVNGYQTVDWTDTRPPNDNARNGCKLGAGPISLQGHDPTTNLSFRNLRVAELK